MARYYGNGMKGDVTRCIEEVYFGSWSRQCLRKRNWWVEGRAVGNIDGHVDKLYCRQHAQQLARKYQEGEW